MYNKIRNDKNVCRSGGIHMNNRRVMAVITALGFILSTVAISDLVKAETNIITLTAKLTIKEGKEKEFETLMKGIVPQVRKEEGNISYIMCRSKDNPRLFLFFEEYADQAAVQAHGKHLRSLGIDFAAYLDGPPVAEYYEKIAY